LVKILIGFLRECYSDTQKIPLLTIIRNLTLLFRLQIKQGIIIILL